MQTERKSFLLRKELMLPVAEIAKRAGVSAATVSRALNNRGVVRAETCQKVYAVLEELNVDVTKLLAESEPSGKVILFNLPFEINAFFNEIIRGAKASATRHGYHLLINQEHINTSTYRKVMRLIRDLHVNGVISLNFLPPELRKDLIGLVPFVQCCAYDLSSTEISSVSINDFQISEDVVKYLCSIGKNRVAFVSGQIKYTDNYNRRMGYLQALKDLGHEPPAEWIVQLPDIDYGIALATATQLLSNPNRPNAFFAISDIFASAIIHAAQQLGMRVPEDVAVVGFDNLDYAQISNPTITTVNSSQYQMGFTACELLVDKLQNPDAVTQHIQLSSELVIRQSTGVGLVMS